MVEALFRIWLTFRYWVTVPWYAYQNHRYDKIENAVWLAVVDGTPSITLNTRQEALLVDSIMTSLSELKVVR